MAEHTDIVDIPEEIVRREERLETIKKARAEIEARAAVRYDSEKKAYDAKISKRKEKIRESEKKPSGKPQKKRSVFHMESWGIAKGDFRKMKGEDSTIVKQLHFLLTLYQTS